MFRISRSLIHQKKLMIKFLHFWLLVIFDDGQIILFFFRSEAEKLEGEKEAAFHHRFDGPGRTQVRGDSINDYFFGQKPIPVKF